MEGHRHVNETSDLCVFNSKRMEETPRCLFYASGNELRADRKVAVVPAFTIRRDCVETQFPWNSPTPLLLPPLPSSVLTGVDARNTRRGRGRCLFSVRRHHEEERKERRSGLSSKKVLGLLDAPPSLPPSFWITASKERGTMELVSLSLSSFRLSRIPVKQTAYLALSRQTAAIRRIINNTLHAAFDGQQTNSRAACGLSLANYREWKGEQACSWMTRPMEMNLCRNLYQICSLRVLLR